MTLPLLDPAAVPKSGAAAEAYATAVSMFLGELGARARALESACLNADCRVVAREARALASSSRAIGAVSLAHWASNLTVLAEEEHPAALRGGLAALQGVLVPTMRALESATRRGVA